VATVDLIFYLTKWFNLQERMGREKRNWSGKRWIQFCLDRRSSTFSIVPFDLRRKESKEKAERKKGKNTKVLQIVQSGETSIYFVSIFVKTLWQSKTRRR
jgi:hypothetical protein